MVSYKALNTDGKSLPFIKTEPIYSPRDLKDFFNENNK